MKKLLGWGVAGFALAVSAMAQISIVDNLPGAFIDISGTGTNLAVEGDDINGTFAATHGNSILPVGNLLPSTNGTVTSPATNGFTNGTLSGTSNAGYYPLWDDFRTDSGGGDIFAQNLADRTIIQWNNLRTFDAPGTDLGTWQLQIFSSGPILAQYLYSDVGFGNANSNGGSATIGAVQTGTSPRQFAQWSFNVASIQSGSILSVIPEPASAMLLALGGLALLRRR
jgi:hypothetical protein